MELDTKPTDKHANHKKCGDNPMGNKQLEQIRDTCFCITSITVVCKYIRTGGKKPKKNTPLDSLIAAKSRNLPQPENPQQ